MYVFLHNCKVLDFNYLLRSTDYYQFCTKSAAFISNPNVQNPSYGQPTPESHPHLLEPGEIVQGITLDEIKNRRIELMENIHKHVMSIDNNSKSNLVNLYIYIISATVV